MKNKEVVNKIITHIEKITAYTDGLSEEEFQTDTKTVEACVFNLSQIGELTKHVDDEFEKNHPEVPWRMIYGLRNKIVHDYEGVNMKLIWEIIEDLPELLKTLTDLA
ncbi:MAG: DUF86 domain-containing protein [Blautia sp.]|nr:DUF86 domain-containing protein [Blautia sp.]